MLNLPKIGITMGDPAGNGPELTVQALMHKDLYERCRPLVVGDAKMLEKAASILGHPELKIHRISQVSEAVFEYGTIDVLHMDLIDLNKFEYGKVSEMCGMAAFLSVKKVIELAMIVNIIIQSIILTIAVLSIYLFALNKYPDFMNNKDHLAYARTYAFTVLVCAELVMSVSSRSERYLVFKLGLFSNKILNWALLLSFGLMAVVVYVPFLRPIFGTIYLHPFDLAVILIPCILPFITGELYKVICMKLKL